MPEISPPLDQLLAGRRLADAGDTDGAERVFLDLLRRHAGSCSVTERDACSSLVTLYGRQVRTFETAVLAQRLRQLGELEPADPGSLAYAAFARATSWTSLRAFDAAEAELERLSLLLPEVPGVRGRLIGRGFHALRLRLALSHQDEPAARQSLACYEATLADAPITDSDRTLHGLRSADLLVLQGHPEDALVRIEATEAHISVVQDRVRLELQRLELLADLSGDHDVRGSATRLVEFLEETLEAQASQLAWDAGCRLLECLARDAEIGAASELLPRTWSLITTALVRRTQELRRALELLPELPELLVNDRRIFEASAHRDRNWRDGKRATLEPLFRRFRNDSPVPSDEVLCICAWCDSVRLQHDRWVPFLDAVSIAGPNRVSHGICPECTAGLHQQAMRKHSTDGVRRPVSWRSRRGAACLGGCVNPTSSNGDRP